MLPPSLKVKSIKTKRLGSPEEKLGIQLEKALSPKSKKEKMRKTMKDKIQAQGKVEVLKKKKEANTPITSVTSNGSEKSGKKRRRRGKRSHSEHNENDINEPPLLADVNAKNAVKALLKSVNSIMPKQKELFDDDKFIYLQLNLFKTSPKTKAVLHYSLPHSILPDSPEICLITPDLKGKRNDPDEAIDHYQELLRKHGINLVSEVIPVRKLNKEYSQFEERKKMANRFDAILVDGRVNKRARLGRRFGGTKKCFSCINFQKEDLKSEFEKALKKVALFSSGTGLSFSIKCGRVGMAVNDVVENIVKIGDFLAKDKIVVGDRKNIGSLYVKTALSDSFPVFVSLISPNEVPIPKGQHKKLPKPVEGDVTTVQGASVVVYPSGEVKLKKRKSSEVEEHDIEADENSTPSPKKSKVDKTNVTKPSGKKSTVMVKGTTPDDDEDDEEDESDDDFDFENYEEDSDADSEKGSDEEDDEGEEEEEEDDDLEQDDESDDDEDEEEEVKFNSKKPKMNSPVKVPENKALKQQKLNKSQKSKGPGNKPSVPNKAFENQSPKSQSPANSPAQKKKKNRRRRKSKGSEGSPEINQKVNKTPLVKASGIKSPENKKANQTPLEKVTGTKSPEKKKVNQRPFEKATGKAPVNNKKTNQTTAGKAPGSKPPKKNKQSPKFSPKGNLHSNKPPSQQKKTGGKPNASPKKPQSGGKKFKV